MNELINIYIYIYIYNPIKVGVRRSGDNLIKIGVRPLGDKLIKIRERDFQANLKNTSDTTHS